MEELPARVRRQRKKLALVARIQARGQLNLQASTDDTDAEYCEALAAFGLQEADSDDGIEEPVIDGAVIASEARQSTHDNTCYLWPENVQTFIVWQNLRTQWRFAANGKAIGLDYPGVYAYFDIHGIDNKADIFTGLQAMEFAALAALREQQQG